MKIFIDSADIAEIKEAVALSCIDGCTTNPSLLGLEKFLADDKKAAEKAK